MYCIQFFKSIEKNMLKKLEVSYDFQCSIKKKLILYIINNSSQIHICLYTTQFLDINRIYMYKHTVYE